MKTDRQIDDDIYEAAELLASAENRSVCKVLLQVEEERFPVFSVSKDSPPITLGLVKAAFDDDI